MICDLQRVFPIKRIVFVLLAYACLLAADEAGADYQSGLAAYEEGNFTEAVNIWRPLAHQGDAGAQYGLGVSNLNGEGVPQDHSNAIIWFRKAAERGHLRAQVKLGAMYVLGLGVEIDTELALSWFLKAAKKNDVQAKLHVGESYYLGRGTDQNLSEAVKWFKSAARQGSQVAQHILGTIYDGKNEKLAFKWYRKGAQAGYPPAQRDLANLYKDGRGVRRNLVRAYMWYDLAAQQGDREAEVLRDNLLEEMSEGDITEAKSRSAYWRRN